MPVDRRAVGNHALLNVKRGLVQFGGDFLAHRRQTQCEQEGFLEQDGSAWERNANSDYKLDYDNEDYSSNTDRLLTCDIHCQASTTVCVIPRARRCRKTLTERVTRR